LAVNLNNRSGFVPQGSPPKREMAKPEFAKPTLTGPRVWRRGDPDWRNRHWRLFGWRNRLKHR
jgi:hypothetical protein